MHNIFQIVFLEGINVPEWIQCLPKEMVGLLTYLYCVHQSCLLIDFVPQCATGRRKYVYMSIAKSFN